MRPEKISYCHYSTKIRVRQGDKLSQDVCFCRSFVDRFCWKFFVTSYGQAVCGQNTTIRSGVVWAGMLRVVAL